MKNKKILFFTNSIPAYRVPWFECLDANSDIKFVITNQKLVQKNYKTETPKNDISNVIYLSEGLKWYKELKKILNENEQYDFVEFPPIDSAKEYFISKILLRYCKKYKYKTGYFWEKWEAPEEKQPLKRKIKNFILRIVPRSIYKNIDVIFAGSSESKKYFKKNNITEEHIVLLPDTSVVPNCRYENIRSKYSIPDDRKIILYFGRLIPEKGADVLIRAFAQVPNRKSYHLLIAGDGPERDMCETLSRNLNIDNITFAGLVDPSKRKNYFSQCDVFVFPCTFRGGWVDVWGLTNNEAMQYGKPVISTFAVGSAIDLIKPGINGYIIEPGNDRELCDTIEKIFNSNILKTSKEYDKKLMKKYSTENMTKIFLESI